MNKYTVIAVIQPEFIAVTEHIMAKNPTTAVKKFVRQRVKECSEEPAEIEIVSVIAGHHIDLAPLNSPLTFNGEQVLCQH